MKRIILLILTIGAIVVSLQSCTSSNALKSQVDSVRMADFKDLQRTKPLAETTIGRSTIGYSAQHFDGMDYLFVHLGDNSIAIVNLTKDALEVELLKKQLNVKEK